MTKTEQPPSPVRVSFTGIDGAGKDTVAFASLARIARDDQRSVIKLGRPSYALAPGSGERRPVFQRTLHVLDTLHHLADRRESRLGIAAVNACNVLVQSRLLERHITRSARQPDIIASSRDLRVDPAAYCTFYMPRLGRLSMPRRIQLLQALTDVNRDLIIHLKVSPDLAVERIERRITTEACGDAESPRLKWRHMHEYRDDLELLAAEQEAALAHLQNVTATPVLSIETDGLSVEQTAQYAYQAINKVLENRGQIG